MCNNPVTYSDIISNVHKTSWPNLVDKLWMITRSRPAYYAETVEMDTVVVRYKRNKNRIFLPRLSAGYSKHYVERNVATVTVIT